MLLCYKHWIKEYLFCSCFVLFSFRILLHFHHLIMIHYYHIHINMFGLFFFLVRHKWFFVWAWQSGFQLVSIHLFVIFIALPLNITWGEKQEEEEKVHQQRRILCDFIQQKPEIYLFIYFFLREWTNAHELIPNINLYICMKICYIVFECDIFCGCCWMNYENECNALYYLAYDTFFFSSSSTFFSAGFKCCWCVISKRAHTHRLTRSGFRFPFIDAFAINILCATKTMVFNNAMRRLLLLFWNQKLVFVSFSINKIISYCNRLAGWAWA